ncbi:MAG: TetR/AcrR family transcriptional regulator [Kiloniellales bacterium]|nr:TetR/AcrR family transcriptional regulator [Kiloniellales bacterium]
MSNLNRPERTRRDILDAAWDLVAERGAEVSLAEIAKAAGITRQSIYLHFGSRGGLLFELVRRTDERERIFQRFDEAMKTPEPAERLDRCLCVWFDFVSKIQPVALDLIRLRSRDEDAARAWNDRMQDLRRVLRHLVRGLRQEGALADFWTVPRATDYLWAGCSVQAWALLVKDRGWSEAAASKALRHGLARALLA